MTYAKLFRYAHRCNYCVSDSFDTDPDPGFWRPKTEKNFSKKNKKKFWIKNYNLLIPRPPERKSKPQKRLSALKREHPALHNMKFLNFFLLLWVIFALLDPDTDALTWLNPDPRKDFLTDSEKGEKGGGGLPYHRTCTGLGPALRECWERGTPPASRAPRQTSQGRCESGKPVTGDTVYKR